MVTASLGLSGLPCSFLRFRINHLACFTFLSLAFRTLSSSSSSSMQLSIFVDSTYVRDSVHILRKNGQRGRPHSLRCVVGSSGLETTNKLAYVRSHLSPSQLLLCGGLKWTRNYQRIGLCEVTLIAPATCVAWWAQVDSNHRPHAYQACALTS